MKQAVWLKKALVFLGAFLVLRQAAVAQRYTIYIYNKPFHSKIVMKSGTAYVPVEALAAALHLTAPSNPQSGVIQVNGKPFSDLFMGSDHQVYVPLKAFVEASGNKIFFNGETGMIDIVPGSSVLTNSLVQSLEQNSVFAPPAPPPGQTAQSAPSPPPLSTEIKLLQEKYAGALSAQADFETYLHNLLAWAVQNESVLSQFRSRMAEISQMPDKSKALEASSEAFQWLGSQIPQLQQSFEQIIPPQQFQDSYNILKRIVESNSQLLPYLQEASQLMLQARTANSAQASAILNRLLKLKEEIHNIAQEELQAEGDYLNAFSADLKSLKQ